MNKLLFTLFLWCLALGTQAQNPLQVGLKAGGNYSNLAGDASAYTNSRQSNSLYLRTDKVGGMFGLQAGVFLALPLSDRFSLQPEVLYSGKGYSFTQSRQSVETFGDQVEEEYKFRSHYLDVPLLAQARVGSFYLEAGPALSFLVAAKEDLTQTFSYPEWSEKTTEERHTSTSSTAGTRRVSLGYALGAGYALPNGVGIGLRYSGDFTSLAENEYNGETPNVRNSVVQVSLSYIFWKR
ncbi:porin family protein [Nibribacter koreensis]|uniref:Outer membrane protein beta-barrel domain-containing protein n=1 Tax=Nibribacter koreensis TaxID=1084519 RepID=A0ABP8FLS8_9BACT